MNKKGVYFTFMAIFVIILIVAVITTRETHRYRNHSNAITARVRSMDNFVDDLEKDLDREMFIGGYRSVLGLHSHIRESEDFVQDMDGIFSEIFVNGTAQGVPIDIMEQKTQGAHLNGWLRRVNEESNKMNIAVSMDVHKVRLYHTTPWSIRMELNTTINISDVTGIASWKFNKKYTQDFVIYGFEDPLYTVGTSDKVTNLINSTPVTDFVDLPDVGLYDHLMGSYYVNTSRAPSYLMRFEGDLSPSPYGIESMVNLEELDLQNIPLLERSVIDYIYFGNQTTSDYCDVSKMPDWFRIHNDADVIDFYEIDELNVSTC